MSFPSACMLRTVKVASLARRRLKTGLGERALPGREVVEPETVSTHSHFGLRSS